MIAPAAIRAVFAEWRMVKTRKVLALVFEIPLEQQGDVLTILGAPMPDAEIWCGIARLNLSVKPLDRQSVDGATAAASSERGKQRYASSSDMEKALIRAAMLPDDVRFRTWAIPPIDGGRGRFATKELAEQFIRDNCCAGESRKLIAKDRSCFDAFIRMEESYMTDTGRYAEFRG